MKNLVLKLSLLVFLLVLLFGAEAGTDNQAELYEKRKQELTTAVEVLNFKDAKESISELMPLMKDDIKSTKKALATAKKEKKAHKLKYLTKKLERKSEIVEQLDHILKSSPAALRVKASDAVQLVDEFGDLTNWSEAS